MKITIYLTNRPFITGLNHLPSITFLRGEMIFLWEIYIKITIKIFWEIEPNINW